MQKSRLSDDQRRIMAFFVDNPPDDRIGLLSAVEYLIVISDHIAETIDEGVQWEEKDLDLMVKMSEQLGQATFAFTSDTKFWEKVQHQLSGIHPSLKAKL